MTSWAVLSRVLVHFFSCPSIARSVFCSQLGQHAFCWHPHFINFFRNSYNKSIPIWLSITVLTLARFKPPFQGYEFVDMGISVILPFSFKFSPNIVEASIEYQLYMTVEIPVYLSKQMLMSYLGNHYHLGIMAMAACHKQITRKTCSGDVFWNCFHHHRK